jgi:CHAT domain-containing protein/tetratricopeptide (TPR) repeat protein
MTCARRALHVALVSWVCQHIVTAAPDNGASQSGTIEILRPGVMSHGVLDEKGMARFHIAVAEGDGFEVTVTQPDVDLRLHLSGPSGQGARVNLRRPQQGAERVLGATTVAGVALVSIERAGGSPNRPTRFSITASVHPATDRERRWSDAARAYAQGESQVAAGTSDGLRAALPLFEEARGAWRQADSPLEAAAALNQIGLVQMQLSNLQPARVAHEEGLALRRTIGDRYGEGVALNNLAAIHSRLGDYRTAAKLYEEAVAVRREVEDRTGLAYSLMGLAVTRGRVDSAWSTVIGTYEEALTLLEQTGDRRGQAEALYNLGYGHKQVNAFVPAAAYFDRALTIRREVNDLAGQASVLTQIAAMHLQLGDAARALEILEQARPLRQRAGDRRGEAYTAQTIGVALTRLGQSQPARARLSEALQIFEAVGDREGQTSALTHLASLHAATGAHAEALAVAQRAQRVAGTSFTLITTILSSVVGDAHLALGDREEAFAAYTHAAAEARRLGEALPEARALAGLGRVARIRGDHELSRRHLLDALDRIESVRASVPQSELRASFLGATQDSYTSTIETLLALHQKHPSDGYAVEALAVSERQRARTLVELLADAQADLRSTANQPLLNKEDDIRRRLNLAAGARAGETPGSDATSGADREIGELVAALRTVRAQIRTENPRYGAVVHPAPLDLRGVQQLLDPETILLEYSLGETRSYLWAITPTTMTVHTLPGRARIEALVRRVGELIASSARRGTRGPMQRTLAEVSDMLLGGVATEITNKRLAIVPDGALQFLPFGALPPPHHAANGAPLIVRHEIVILPSASALYELRQDPQRSTPAKTVAILADPVFQRDDARLPLRASPKTSPESEPMTAPTATLTGAVGSPATARLERLPHTRTEALTISRKSRGQALMALGFDATRELVLSPSLRDYRIVHFATHTLLDTRHPELSAIVLTLVDRAGAPLDGYLRLHDVFKLRLDAGIVVLSACETALGENIRGEGLVGLTRGFMHAGASQVIASLWKVNDRATALLMEEFYSGLLDRGLTPSAALRAAQITLWKNPRWRMPIYWAGFAVQGDWRPSP